MMKAVIPHLRLLTLPMDKLDPLSKYLSDSQMMSYMAKKPIFNAYPPLNLSTKNRPKSNEFDLNFIADELIKTDWDKIVLEPKKNPTLNTLQVELVAGQSLVLKGIEILTRANNYPQFDYDSSDSEDSSR